MDAGHCTIILVSGGRGAGEVGLFACAEKIFCMKFCIQHGVPYSARSHLVS